MLPKIPIPQQSKESIHYFGGYNHNITISDNEFFDMINLSSDGFPTLCPRPKRGVVKSIGQCNALLSKEELAYVSGSVLHYGDFSMTLDETIDGERQLVSMGAYVIVFPDMYYLNTQDTTENGRCYLKDEKFRAAVTNGVAEGSNITFTICDAAGNDIAMTYIRNYQGFIYFGSAVSPSDGEVVSLNTNAISLPIEEGETVVSLSASLWGVIENTYDTNGGIPLDQFDGSFPITPRSDTVGEGTAMFYNPDTSGYRYVKVVTKSPLYPKAGEYLLDENGNVSCFSQSGEWINVDSYVKIRIIGETNNEDFSIFTTSFKLKLTQTASVSSVRNPLRFLAEEYSSYKATPIKKQSNIVSSEDEKIGVELIVPGRLYRVESFSVSDSTADNSVEIDLHYLPPKMDFLIECGNRLWGCRYGENSEGTFVNEIYASALGSFREWYDFSGISTDSYIASVGTDGEFTGAINYRGQPIFFKENSYHAVYGSYPANFQITTDTGIGVQKDSHKSLCVIQNVLYFKAVDGIYRYDGASYNKISEPLGLVSYIEAAAGSIDNKYYVSMKNGNGEWCIFVYDTEKGLWHKEDLVCAKCFTRHKNDLYFVDSRDGLLYTVKGTVGTKESEDVSWMAETGKIGYSVIDAKYLDKLQLRVELPVGSEVRLYAEYDSDGYFEFIGAVSGKSNRAFTIPIFPRRCDHFKLRVEGEGECKIFNLVKVMENGGEW